MVILITGASHTGKTLLAQKMLEKYKYPYLSIDHLKMGLIRSGNTNLTALSENELLTSYLWPVVCEMIKTAIENGQNLIVEGCYISVDWQAYFESSYLENITCCCLVMSEDYIRHNFESIMGYANAIENRLDDDFTLECALEDNAYYLSFARNSGAKLVLIDDKYDVEGAVL